MKNNNILTISVLAASLTSSLAHADAPTTFTPAQKVEIGQIIRDYLVKDNPAVLIEASQALQSQQQAQVQKKAQTAIAQHGGALVGGNLTVAGNPKGDVTLVEFFDYACGHCIKMKPVINALIEKNPNLRVIYRVFPIFGKESETASRVAIAAAMQGKYGDIHAKLFNGEHQLNEEKILSIAKKSGLDMSKLKIDMNSSKVSSILDESRKLAEAIHLMGTPAFIVLSTPNGEFKSGSESTFVPGATSQANLQDLIKKASVE